jgi:hypothetical protein
VTNKRKATSHEREDECTSTDSEISDLDTEQGLLKNTQKPEREALLPLNLSSVIHVAYYVHDERKETNNAFAHNGRKEGNTASSPALRALVLFVHDECKEGRDARQQPDHEPRHAVPLHLLLPVQLDQPAQHGDQVRSSTPRLDQLRGERKKRAEKSEEANYLSEYKFLDEQIQYRLNCVQS